MTRHECNGRVVPLRAAPACRYAATGRHRFGVLTAVRRAWQRWPNLCCHRNTLAFLYEPLIDVGERSGQLRPYVRPVARHLPLAIMGVRMRVRHQSVGRAQGTRLLPVLPELFLTTASHHAVQRFLPDQPGLRPAPTALRQNVTRPLPLRPQHVLSPGRPLYASSTPTRCAPSCLPSRPLPA